MGNKHLVVGPGGTKCSCCFPAPGSKERKLAYRQAKRKEEREAIKVELETLKNSDDE